MHTYMYVHSYNMHVVVYVPYVMFGYVPYLYVYVVST